MQRPRASFVWGAGAISVTASRTTHWEVEADCGLRKASANEMRLEEFRIGQEFYCAGKRWRCTDVGTRVVVAICLEPHEVVSTTVGQHAQREHLQFTDELSWFNGPPFAVVEEVFDECSIEACSFTPTGEDSDQKG